MCRLVPVSYLLNGSVIRHLPLSRLRPEPRTHIRTLL